MLGKLSAYVVRDASAWMTEPSHAPTGDCSPTSANQTRAVKVEEEVAARVLAAKMAEMRRKGASIFGCAKSGVIAIVW